MIFGKWLTQIAVTLVVVLSVATMLATLVGHQFVGLELAYSQFSPTTGAASLRFLDVQRGVTMSQSLAHMPSQLEWSPDGTQLALGYVDWVEIVDLNGKSRRIDGVYAPMWDSTGRLLLIASTDAGWRLRSYDIDNLQLGEPLTQSVERNLLAAFLSPDDRWLAFTTNDHLAQGGLFVTDLQTSEVRFLIPSHALLHSFSIAWSLDSRALVSSRWLVGARSALTALDVENESEYSLTDSDEYLVFPSWSPSGTQLAFIKRDLVQMRQTLGLLYIDGTLQEIDINALSGLAVMEMEHPEWSPDERAIVLLLNIGRERFIYLLSLESAPTLQRLTSAGADAFAWRP